MQRWQTWTCVLASCAVLCLFTWLQGEDLRQSIGDLAGGCFQGRFARHYAELGLWDVGGRPIFNVYPKRGGPELESYENHPPLLYWLGHVSCTVFGYTPFALRAPQYLAFLLTVGAVLLLADRRAGHGWRWAAVLLMVATPQALLNGSTPHNQPLTMMAVMTTWLSLRWLRRTGSTKSMVAVACSGLLGVFSDWQYALYAPLFLWLALTGDAPHRRRSVIVLAATGVGATGLLALWFHGADGGHESVLGAFQGRLEQLFAHRVGWELAPEQVEELIGDVVLGRFQAPVLVLAGVGAVLALREVWLRTPGAGLAAAQLLYFGAVVADAILLAGNALIHDYWTLPGVVVIATLGIRPLVFLAQLRTRWPTLPRLAALAVLFVVCALGIRDSLSRREAITSPLPVQLARELKRRVPEDSFILTCQVNVAVGAFLEDLPIGLGRYHVPEISKFQREVREGRWTVGHLYYVLSPEELPPAPFGVPEYLIQLPWESFDVPMSMGHRTFYIARIAP